MPGGAGFPYQFVVDGDESSWKQIDVSGGNPGVNSTSRLNPDGSTNESDGGCFADREADENTLTIRLTEMMRASDDVRGDATTIGLSFIEGDRDPTSVWTVAYDGVITANGTGLYCARVDLTGSIPGEGRGVTEFQAIGPYTRNQG